MRYRIINKQPIFANLFESEAEYISEQELFNYSGVILAIKLPNGGQHTGSEKYVVYASTGCKMLSYNGTTYKPFCEDYYSEFDHSKQATDAFFMFQKVFAIIPKIETMKEYKYIEMKISALNEWNQEWQNGDITYFYPIKLYGYAFNLFIQISKRIIGEDIIYGINGRIKITIPRTYEEEAKEIFEPLSQKYIRAVINNIKYGTPEHTIKEYVKEPIKCINLQGLFEGISKLRHLNFCREYKITDSTINITLANNAELCIISIMAVDHENQKAKILTTMDGLVMGKYNNDSVESFITSLNFKDDVMKVFN